MGTYKRLILFVYFLALFSLVLFQEPVFAVGLREMSDVMTRLKVGVAANHTVSFLSTSGIGPSGGTITVNFNNAISALGVASSTVTYEDVDLLYGAVGQEQQQALFSEAGTNVWGAAFNNATKVLTLTYPASNGTPILSNWRVIIRIGTHATYERQGTRQMINRTTVGPNRLIPLTAGSDSGTVAVVIVLEDSAEVSGKTLPGAPTSLTALPLSSTDIRLTWKDNASDETQFFIERRKGGGAYSRMITKSANAITHTDILLTPDTTYTYRIQASNADGDSLYSNEATAVTQGESIAFEPTQTPTEKTPSVEEKPVVEAEKTPSEPVVVVEEIQAPQEIVKKEVPSEQTTVKKTETPKQLAEQKAAELLKELQKTESLSKAVVQEELKKESTAPVIVKAPEQTKAVLDTSKSSVIETKTEQGTGVSIEIPQGVRGFSNAAAQEAGTAQTVVPSSPSSQSSGKKGGAEGSPSSQSAPQPTTQIRVSETTTVTIVPLSNSQSSSLVGSSILTSAPFVSYGGGGSSAPASSFGGQQSSSAQEIRKVPVGPTWSVYATSLATEPVSMTPSVKMAQGKKQEGRRGFLSLVTLAKHLSQKILGVSSAYAESSGTPSAQQAFPDYQKERPVAIFDPPLRYTFSYSDEELTGIDESTVKLYSWDPIEEEWKIEQSVLNAEKNTLTASISHLTIFRMFGDATGLTQREVIIAPSSAVQVIETEIEKGDLKLSKDGAAFSITDKTFYTTPNTKIEMCLAASLFKKPIKRIVISIGKKQFPLAYDKGKDCYTSTAIAVPDNKGTQNVVLKVIYVDDQVQTIRLETVVTSELQAAVLSVAVPALAQIREVAVAVNTGVQKTVENTEPVLKTTAVAAVPMVSVANPSVATNALNWYHYLNHILSGILSFLGFRRRRKAWGVVYESTSKTPIDLAIVRLFEKKSGHLVETQVTDKQGRFSFLAPPGQYTITVSKHPLLFPSKIVTGKNDGEYTHIYHGDVLTVTTAEEVLSINIPLDPPTHQHAKGETAWQMVHSFFREHSRGSLGASMIVSIFLTVYTPSTFNSIFLIVNIIFVITQTVFMASGGKPWGVVFDSVTGHPLPLAAIGIIDVKSKKLLKIRLTDYQGKFHFLPPPGSYIMTISKDQYRFPPSEKGKKQSYHHLYLGGIVHISKRRMHIKMNVPLQPSTLVT